MIEILDIVLINIVSYCFGIFTGFGIYHKCKRTETEYNNNNILTNPMDNYESSPPQTIHYASAPSPFNLNSSPVLAAQPQPQPPPQQTEIIIKNKTTE
tara:strand:+ start:173 stop:466 length:294 start_codon:yes stop_codon:yes gene_type:complete